MGKDIWDLKQHNVFDLILQILIIKLHGAYKH